MKFFEIYTNNKDKKSYFREVEASIEEQQELGIYSKPYAVKTMIFRSSPTATEFPLHKAPQQQFIVYRSGEVEVTASSGETRRFKAGDVLLVSDTHGEGHITKIINPGDALVIAVDEMPRAKL